MKATNINFVFIRHGQGCHNLISLLNDKKLKTPIDPQLSDIGFNHTKKNAKILETQLKYKSINKIDLVVCSPLIRTMETAFLTSQEMTNSTKKIYVVPFLREIDEMSSDVKSAKSRKVIDTEPSYAMLPLDVQKEYLQKQGILSYFNFDFVKDDTLRKEPGDINDFIKWIDTTKLLDTKESTFNILAITHAGVMRRKTHRGYYNNLGFILKFVNSYPDDVYDLDDYDFIKSPSSISKNLACPQGVDTERCSFICNPPVVEKKHWWNFKI